MLFTKRKVKMAGHWPSYYYFFLFAFVMIFMDRNKVVRKGLKM